MPMQKAITMALASAIYPLNGKFNWRHTAREFVFIIFVFLGTHRKPLKPVNSHRIRMSGVTGSHSSKCSHVAMFQTWLRAKN